MADHVRLSYPTIRDRFLATHDKQEQAVLLVEVGRYVQHCWLAEENERRLTGKDLTETELFHLWDECNEGQFEDICVKAREVLDDYARRQTATVVRNAISKRIKPLNWAIVFVRVFLRDAIAGFFGAVGLLIFGLLFLFLQPNVVKNLRQAMDDLLPAATKPVDQTEVDTAPAPGRKAKATSRAPNSN